MRSMAAFPFVQKANAKLPRKRIFRIDPRIELPPSMGPVS
ncbi:hypothetical protein JAGODDHD_02441 [Sphingomonas paucimobilis]|nr:hypothetical protein [Sphingomonas paucimobilis]SUJ14812.1 Uncharacterised protein [Sphingomonas paucimobilis]